MLYTFVIVLHIVASIFLIAVILLQAGRGGGLADSFGGSQMQSLFGTKSANVLTKMTTVCAILFIITCLTLALISSHRSKSLVEKVRLPEARSVVDFDASNGETKTKESDVDANVGEKVHGGSPRPAPHLAPEEAQGGANETGTE
ncbi:preprotein translocase subunit SecG [Candidatus Omnitrophota bacterium]